MSPEIRFPKPSVWADFELDTQLIDPPVIRLKVMPLTGEAELRRALQLRKVYPDLAKEAADKKAMEALDDDEKIDMLGERLPEAVKVQIPAVMGVVIGWDLTSGGSPITCSDSNKKKYLEPLLWQTMKSDDPKKRIYLVRAIIDFATDLRNFTKN
jgi:hypothetical protein